MTITDRNAIASAAESLVSKPRRTIGILTPASNTNLEPITSAMLGHRADVSAHFSRFALPQSLETPIGCDEVWPAAELLAAIDPDVIVFHGTAGSWTGPAGDRALAEELGSRLGCPVTTATLAVLDALRSLDARDIGIAFPGPSNIAREIAVQYKREGFACRCLATSGLRENRSIGAMEPDAIRELVSRAHDPGFDAVAIIGTNLRAAPLVPSLEEELQSTVVDSTIATAWHVLGMIGETDPIPGWGRLLQSPR